MMSQGVSKIYKGSGVYIINGHLVVIVGAMSGRASELIDPETIKGTSLTAQLTI